MYHFENVEFNISWFRKKLSKMKLLMYI